MLTKLDRKARFCEDDIRAAPAIPLGPFKAIAGVMVFEVPAPLGSVVLEPLDEFVQLMTLEYDPMADVDPAAIASVRV